MDTKMHELRREHWRKIIFDCNNREPGVTKREWCETNGICIKSLYYWQRQFRSEAVSSIETAVAVQRTQKSQFLDITASIASGGNETTIPSSDKRPLVPELMIQSGSYQIYVSSAVQERTLETVMKVLRHA